MRNVLIFLGMLPLEMVRKIKTFPISFGQLCSLFSRASRNETDLKQRISTCVCGAFEPAQQELSNELQINQIAKNTSENIDKYCIRYSARVKYSLTPCNLRNLDSAHIHSQFEKSSRLSSPDCMLCPRFYN